MSRALLTQRHGMGLDVESSGPGPGFPLGFWFLLEIVRVSDELVGGEYSTIVHIESRGSCHFLGGFPHIPSGDSVQALALSHQREGTGCRPPDSSRGIGIVSVR